MKTDINGHSTTAPGQEQYETYYSPTLHATCIQYDYRTPQGQLFSCAAPTLEAARARRDAWLLAKAKRCANCGFTHGDHEWCTGNFGNG